MKNTFKVFGIAATIAVIGLVSACGNGTTGSPPNSGGSSDPTSVTYYSTDGTNNYELLITKSNARAAYSPQAGDSYVMTINPGNKKSSGTVKSFTGGKFTLTKDNTEFSVTITNSIMTKIEGEIPCDDGGKAAPSAALTQGSAFNSVADFSAWLNRQPANTTATAYVVKLNIEDSGELYDVSKSILGAKNKYIYLDLSGSTITAIPDGVFYDFDNKRPCEITGIIIPDSVKIIEMGAFYECINLTSVTIGNGVEVIGSISFTGSGLTSVTIPNSVKTIDGWGAFSKCASLTSATIGNGVEVIGNGIFAECTSLTSIVIPDSVKRIEGWGGFQNCTSLKSVTIGNNVEYIGGGSFDGCTSLTSIVIPDSVITIEGWGGFQDCTSLTTVVIGSGVKTIGGFVFVGCTNIKSITFKGSIPRWDDNKQTGLTAITFEGNMIYPYYNYDDSIDDGIPGTYLAPIDLYSDGPDGFWTPVK